MKGWASATIRYPSVLFIGILVFVLAIISVILPLTTQAAFPGTDGKIVFMRRDDENETQWQDTGLLTGPRIFHSAIAAGGHIYIFGGVTADGISNLVESAPILVNGSLGNWQTLASLREKRHGFTVVAHGEFLYVIGGNDGSNHLSGIERSRICQMAHWNPGRISLPYRRVSTGKPLS